MKIEELYEVFVKYYEHLYQKVLYSNFKFRPTDDQIRLIGGFIDYLDNQVGLESIGEEWVFNFMVYSFKERKDQKTRFEGKKIPLNWIMGKKSYEMYDKKHESWSYFNNLFIVLYDIKFLNLTSYKQDNGRDYYEELRRQYYKKGYPIHLCLDTVIYTIKSKYCLRCTTKEICKLINQ